VLAQIFDPANGRSAPAGAGPVYLSFDIDSLDPIWAPSGTPEVGGLTSIQALEIVRGCRGLNLIGCDLVEVSPMTSAATRPSWPPTCCMKCSAFSRA
jgi:arginase family enzyme